MTGETRNKRTGISKPAEKSKKFSGFNNAKFINRELTKEEAQICKAQPFTPETLVTMLDRLLDDRYKVTFSFDNYHNCFTSALVPVGDDHDHTGYILTGKGSCAEKAFKQVLFIHFELFHEQWPSGLTKQDLEIDD